MAFPTICSSAFLLCNVFLHIYIFTYCNHSDTCCSCTTTLLTHTASGSTCTTVVEAAQLLWGCAQRLCTPPQSFSFNAERLCDQKRHKNVRTTAVYICAMVVQEASGVVQVLPEAAEKGDWKKGSVNNYYRLTLLLWLIK